MILAYKFSHAAVTSIASVVLSLGTLALAFVTYEQRTDSREAIRAAVKSATTAETALQTAREEFPHRATANHLAYKQSGCAGLYVQ